jgi:hypothetical protein
MNENIDPLIRREFERLGLNIVENERLAEMIISKVNRRRNFLIAMGLLVAALVTVIIVVILANMKPQALATGVSGQAASITQPATADGSQSLPLTGYMDIDGSVPSKAQAIFIFNLRQSNLMQEFTDNPDPIQGYAGKIDVYLVSKGLPDRLVQSYDMSSHTQVNEFSAPIDGQYKWILTFNNPNFKGRVRFAFVRAN